jgi:hypothetical protein
MGDVTYEQVHLMLRLYELRREPRLREARAWFVEHFHPASPEDAMQKYPQGSEENTSVRMVVSYWEMVAGIVNRGLIGDDLFFESNGEIWIVWDRIRPILTAWRALYKNPTVFSNLEAAGTRFEGWREKRAPGSNDAIRRMLEQARPKARSV